jgi:hypothetical protein
VLATVDTPDQAVDELAGGAQAASLDLTQGPRVGGRIED